MAVNRRDRRIIKDRLDTAETTWDAGHVTEGLPPRPVRSRRRHSRQVVRQVNETYRKRRLRLWCGRRGVDEATAVRFIRDRKHCSCDMCNRCAGLGARLRLQAAEKERL